VGDTCQRPRRVFATTLQYILVEVKGAPTKTPN
jgi:hypothetical protein